MSDDRPLDITYSATELANARKSETVVVSTGGASIAAVELRQDAENARAQYVERSLLMARAQAVNAAALIKAPGWSTQDVLKCADVFLNYIITGRIPPEHPRW